MNDRPELLHLLFGAQVGGCETNALELAKHLPRVRHRFLVLGADGPMAAAWRGVGAEVEIVTEDRWRSTAGMVKVVEERAKGASAAMLWHGLVRLPPLIRAFNRLGIRLAVHGGNPAYGMTRRVDWKFRLLHRLYPPAGPLPTYICCSAHVAQSFRVSGYLKRFPTAVVPNGVELRDGLVHAPREYDPQRPFVMGMHARLNAIKDHATLIRAFALVKQKFPNAVLRLAGDGELRGELESLARELGIAVSVEFLGNVANIGGYLEGLDLFTYATTAREGLGNSVAEAMMPGLPCVVTEIGPTRDFAGPDARAVKLVPAYDPAALAECIEVLIPDVEARRTLGNAGREWAHRRYHPAAFAREYARLLGLPGGGL